MWDWGLGFGVQGSGLGTFKFKVHESGFLPYELRPGNVQHYEYPILGS